MFYSPLIFQILKDNIHTKNIKKYHLCFLLQNAEMTCAVICDSFMTLQKEGWPMLYFVQSKNSKTPNELNFLFMNKKCTVRKTCLKLKLRTLEFLYCFQFLSLVSRWPQLSLFVLSWYHSLNMKWKLIWLR